MMFLFAYLGSLTSPPGWPTRLMYLTQATFIAAAFVCFVLAICWKGTRSHAKRDMVAGIGGIATGFGVLMPLELAPFFFSSRGEIMMATVLLILIYPLAVGLFIALFLKLMGAKPPPVPMQTHGSGANGPLDSLHIRMIGGDRHLPL
jgi:thiosulfate dehydrogenase [quinone] large subunit